jgi:hypothetical protein
MATKGIFRVECPHCGEGFDADFWTVVRGDRDHEVKELILSGEFDLLVCPKCEEMVQHEEPFLYIDPHRDLLAFVMPESYEKEKEKWISRMNADYEPVKASLFAGQGLTSDPLYLFGLGQLTARLENDRDREEETDVMEFMAREEGLKNIFVTNGFMTEEALEAASPWLDAANVDLKSFRDEFYRRHCGAHLEPVLETLRGMKKRGIWVEVTTLVIPTLNDDDGELREIAAFIRSLGDDVPWHVSRFFPRYKTQGLPPTPVKTIDRALEIGRQAGLKHVYSGNVPGGESDNTYCSQCKNLLIGRQGYAIRQYNLAGSKCNHCGTELAGIF